MSIVAPTPTTLNHHSITLLSKLHHFKPNSLIKFYTFISHTQIFPKPNISKNPIFNQKTSKTPLLPRVHQEEYQEQRIHMWVSLQEELKRKTQQTSLIFCTPLKRFKGLDTFMLKRNSSIQDTISLIPLLTFLLLNTLSFKT